MSLHALGLFVRVSLLFSIWLTTTHLVAHTFSAYRFGCNFAANSGVALFSLLSAIFASSIIFCPQWVVPYRFVMYEFLVIAAVSNGYLAIKAEDRIHNVCVAQIPEMIRFFHGMTAFSSIFGFLLLLAAPASTKGAIKQFGTKSLALRMVSLAASGSCLEVSLFGLISDDHGMETDMNMDTGHRDTVSPIQRLLKRLEAIGSPAERFQLHESVYEPLEEASIEPPTPAMKPVPLRLQVLSSESQVLVTYYGVPEHNPNRTCTVIPVIESAMRFKDCDASTCSEAKKGAESLLCRLGFRLAYGLFHDGFQAQLGPHDELTLRVVQVSKLKHDEDKAMEQGVHSSDNREVHPSERLTIPVVDQNCWIVRLSSRCAEDGRNIAERDALLHECGKIFDDIFTLNHIPNRTFIK